MVNIHTSVPVCLSCIQHSLSLVKKCINQPRAGDWGNSSLSVVKSWGLLCGTESASSQKYKRIFLGAASRALNVSLFINPQLFLSSPRKKNTEPLHSCLEISCSDHSYVQFQQPCPLCVLSSTSHSFCSCCVGWSDECVYCVESI